LAHVAGVDLRVFGGVVDHRGLISQNHREPNHSVIVLHASVKCAVREWLRACDSASSPRKPPLCLWANLAGGTVVHWTAEHPVDEIAIFCWQCAAGCAIVLPFGWQAL
jgi:hypothetical protein